MDLSFNEFQSMLADSVARFIGNEYSFERRQEYVSRDPGFSTDAWRSFAELGWTAVPFSEADGGLDGSHVELMILMQQFGRGLVVEPYLANIVLAGGVFRRAANEAQKERWLQPLIAGELQAALACTEPQGRYDIANVLTTATPDGSDWVISGNKGVVLNGGNAELLVVPARTGGEQSDRKGISLFAVDAATPGLRRRSYTTVDGHRAAEISLDGARVPGDALLGDEGGGYTALRDAVDEGTFAVGAEAVGIMQVLTEKTVEYAKNRVQFGVPIGSFQALQHRMVDMLTACEQSYSLLLWSAMANAAGSGEARESIHALKYQVGTAGRRVGEEAVQLHGGMGVTWDLDVAHYFKRLTAINLVFGNADWHLDRLANPAPATGSAAA
jgi:alkylation response protein AidB-like acyl-CoA dehydrogenase